MKHLSTVRLFAAATVVAVPLSVAARTVGAQTIDPACANAATVFQDACQKTIDIFNYLAPQLGTAIAGGNATLGQEGTLGGLGHFSLGIRGTVVKGDVPKFSQINIHTNGAAADSLPVSTAPVPMPSIDLGVGLFGGLPLGITRVGTVDLLVNAFYIPKVTSNQVSIHPQHSLQLGFGGRVGIIQESKLVPGLAVTYEHRDLPTTTIVATDNSGDSLRVQNLTLKTTAWRLVAGKKFLILGLAAGVGQDKYDSRTDVGAEVNGLTSGTTALASPHETLTRTNYFGDVSLALPFFRITGEIGSVSGSAVGTYNTFAGSKAGASRLYGAVGTGIKI